MEIFYVTWANVTGRNVFFAKLWWSVLYKVDCGQLRAPAISAASSWPSKYSFQAFSAFLFWQAVNLMLRRWQCTHLGGPRETAAGCWTCPNRWVPSPTEHAVPAPSLLSFSSPSSFLFHLIQQEKWEVTMRSPRSRIECAPCRRQMLAACLWCLELGVGIWILLQCKTISLFQLKSIAILLFWEKTKFYIIQMTR